MNMVDQAALELAMKTAMKSRREQLESMLRDRPWEEVARFAAYCCQCDALELKLWEAPPCEVDEDVADEVDRGAQKLLRKMLAAGLSRFDPDPLASLAAQRKRWPKGVESELCILKRAGRGGKIRRRNICGVLRVGIPLQFV